MLEFNIWLIVCVVFLAVLFWFLNESFNNVPKLKGLIANLIIFGSCAIIIFSVFSPLLHKTFTVG